MRDRREGPSALAVASAMASGSIGLPRGLVEPVASCAIGSGSRLSRNASSEARRVTSERQDCSLGCASVADDAGDRDPDGDSRPAHPRDPRARAGTRSPAPRSCTSRSSPPTPGATITDVDGNTFVDFVGGVGVVNVGHNHPRVVEAIARAGRAVPPHRLHRRPVRALRRRSPSGSARSSPITRRDARRVLQRGRRGRRERGQARAPRTRDGQAVIAFEGGFHGRTLLALTMTSKTHPYKTGLGPFAPEVYRAPFPNAYRGPDAPRRSPRSSACSTTHVARRRTSRRSSSSRSRARAASSRADPAFVAGCARICDEHGIVLVADEVQTGFGRTGPDVRDGALRRRGRPA